MLPGGDVEEQVGERRQDHDEDDACGEPFQYESKHWSSFTTQWMGHVEGDRVGRHDVAVATAHESDPGSGQAFGLMFQR